MTLLRELLGTDLQQRPRRGRIRMAERFVAFPPNPTDLVRKLPPTLSMRLAPDMATSPMRTTRPNPSASDTFAANVRASLGPTMTDRFYAPYVEKLFGIPADQLAGELARRRIGASSAGACGSDDGDNVRSSGGESSGSGSGSGTGLSSSDLSETDNELVNAAVDQYKQYLQQQVVALVAATTTFTNAVRAGDVEAAKAAYTPSRVSWERIEPIAGLVPDIDGATDSRVDDFEGVDDPNFTGWHRLEYLLWEQNTTEGGAQFADKLDADLASLEQQVAGLELAAGALPAGAADLIEEVSEGKITGEEDRYSRTDLWDFAANIEGSKQLIVLLTPAIEAEDPDLG